MKHIPILLFLFVLSPCCGQDSKFSLEVDYGLAGNHFVRSYIETSADGFIPEGERLVAKKDFLGTVSQIQLSYMLRNETSLIIGYSRDSHQKERDYSVLSNGVSFDVVDFSLRHNNNIYFIKHKRNISENIKYHFGIFNLRPEQQEISISGPPFLLQKILFEERDKKNSNLDDGGVMAGVNFEQQIDPHFKAGLKVSGYYLASASTYETTYLTGQLIYTFSKNDRK